MIGNWYTTRNVKDTIRYVWERDTAHRIGGTTIASTVEQCAQEFQTLSTTINEPGQAYHLVLSYSPTDAERLDDTRMADIAQRTVAAMVVAGDDPTLLKQPDRLQEQVQQYLDSGKINQHPFVTVRHTDRAHPHTHTVLLRRGLNRKLISNHFSKLRLQKILSIWESQYELTPVVSSQQTGKRSLTRGQLEAQRQGIVQVQAKLQKLIDRHAQQGSSLPELQQTLAYYDIRMRVRPNGVSYMLHGVAIAGSRLGNRYSLPGLLKRGLTRKEEDSENWQRKVRIYQQHQRNRQAQQDEIERQRQQLVAQRRPYDPYAQLRREQLYRGVAGTLDWQLAGERPPQRERKRKPQTAELER